MCCVGETFRNAGIRRLLKYRRSPASPVPIWHVQPAALRNLVCHFCPLDYAGSGISRILLEMAQCLHAFQPNSPIKAQLLLSNSVIVRITSTACGIKPYSQTVAG